MGQPLLHGDERWIGREREVTERRMAAATTPERHGEGLPRRLCCRELQLQEFPDKYVIRSLDPDAPDHAFSVDRSDGHLQTLSGDIGSETPFKVATIYGVVGVIRLLAGTYVLVITDRQEVGTYLGYSIYHVKSMKFLSCNEALRHSTSQEKKDEAYFMSLLRTVESTPGLYYSYERDITLNLQRACTLDEVRVHKPLWKQGDPRFVWNRNMLEELIEIKLDAFIIPLIQGSFQTIQFTLKKSPVRITLISRRCNRRLGTRMWRRGANLEGDTANFIETEQLVEFEGLKSSFLQIRGSIPLLWEQIVDLSYKPRLSIISHEETPKVVERHFHDLIQRYGETMAVDLTDKHGDEGELSRAFAAEMEKLPHVRYVSFDFHHICGKGNFDNLQLLYDQIKEDVEKQGYFLVNAEGRILSEQNGIIRVNCIDCLDRTNVTQSYMARKSLNSQLQYMGAFSSSECISMYDDIYDMFKILWVQHGDEISLEYAGTLALKGDLVRYGRQTLAGLIKDGMSALSRYYLNNFQDGIRQDAMDLISGRYSVRRNGPSPFQLNAFESLSYLPVASVLIVGGLTLTTLTLNQARHNAQHFVSSVVWAGLTAGVMALVKANGKQFCSRPRLCGLL
ncbi:phosphoinositide phosphatase SAC8 isoform X1 [Phoenix dactylifera]|uniref:Phosphoinositide phosphatase SAC8 isoform X1 n=1 Tax=Phoenix dactylifera TaxID=42345 RepID=A0A8B7C709_PHODC|nr:phosphoinositide phosphatase SAC8 isoform X1 [Phoenix dactylifera]